MRLSLADDCELQFALSLLNVQHVGVRDLLALVQPKDAVIELVTHQRAVAETLDHRFDAIELDQVNTGCSARSATCQWPRSYPSARARRRLPNSPPHQYQTAFERSR
jgi:hypothetical protein